MAGPAEKGKPCRFDERKPMETWPGCVIGFVARDGEMLKLYRSDAAEWRLTGRTYSWDSTAYVLAAGDPRIEQEGCSMLFQHNNAAPSSEAAVDDGSPTEKAAPSQEQAEPTPATAESSEGPSHYCYNALRPTKLDANGRIMAFAVWPVVCGPWPAKAKAEHSMQGVTDAPFAGLHVVDDNCSAESEKALRNAAKASEAVAAGFHFGPIEAHWVRDGYR
jgi:hypothetical protein